MPQSLFQQVALRKHPLNISGFHFANVESELELARGWVCIFVCVGREEGWFFKEASPCLGFTVPHVLKSAAQSCFWFGTLTYVCCTIFQLQADKMLRGLMTRAV